MFAGFSCSMWGDFWRRGAIREAWRPGEPYKSYIPPRRCPVINSKSHAICCMSPPSPSTLFYVKLTFNKGQ